MWRPQRKTASHVLNIRGESYRLREKKQAGLLGVSLVPGPTTGPADEASHPPAWGWVSFQPAQVGHEYAGVDKVRETCVGRGSERSNGCSRPDVRQRPLSALESP
jgi:hypothetical protein